MLERQWFRSVPRTHPPNLGAEVPPRWYPIRQRGGASPLRPSGLPPTAESPGPAHDPGLQRQHSGLEQATLSGGMRLIRIVVASTTGDLLGLGRVVALGTRQADVGEAHGEDLWSRGTDGANAPMTPPGHRGSPSRHHERCRANSAVVATRYLWSRRIEPSGSSTWSVSWSSWPSVAPSMPMARASAAWPPPPGPSSPDWPSGGAGWPSADPPGQPVQRVTVTASTVVVGMILRVIAGQGTAAAFILVAFGFLGATMIGWRLLSMAIGRARTGHRAS